LYPSVDRRARRGRRLQRGCCGPRCRWRPEVLARPLVNACRLRFRAVGPEVAVQFHCGQPAATSRRVNTHAPHLVLRVRTMLRPGAAGRSTSTGSRWLRAAYRRMVTERTTGACPAQTTAVAARGLSMRRGSGGTRTNPSIRSDPVSGCGRVSSDGRRRRTDGQACRRGGDVHLSLG
jgi:hypothetical protein